MSILVSFELLEIAMLRARSVTQVGCRLLD